MIDLNKHASVLRQAEKRRPLSHLAQNRAAVVGDRQVRDRSWRSRCARGSKINKNSPKDKRTAPTRFRVFMHRPAPSLAASGGVHSQAHLHSPASTFACVLAPPRPSAGCGLLWSVDSARHGRVHTSTYHVSVCTAVHWINVRTVAHQRRPCAVRGLAWPERFLRMANKVGANSYRVAVQACSICLRLLRSKRSKRPGAVQIAAIGARQPKSAPSVSCVLVEHAVVRSF